MDIHYPIIGQTDFIDIVESIFSTIFEEILLIEKKLSRKRCSHKPPHSHRFPKAWYADEIIDFHSHAGEVLKPGVFIPGGFFGVVPFPAILSDIKQLSIKTRGRKSDDWT